jgi:hypothetical protein
MSYLGRSAKLSLKAQEKVSFLATAGQTEKTGLSYIPTFVEVHLNGFLLTDGIDYTATNGNSVDFIVALVSLDEVTVISLKTFTVADHYTKSAADTLLAAKLDAAGPLPAIDGSALTGVGKVLQVVRNYTASGAYISTTSTTLVASGISVTITPKVIGSTILIDFSSTMSQRSAAGAMLAIMYQDGAAMAGSGTYHITYNNLGYLPLVFGGSFVATSLSPIVFEPYFKSSNGGITYFNHTGNSYHITATEVGA